MSSTEPTKATSAESIQASSAEPASESTTETLPKLNIDQLRRLKRQLALENELSSAMDESENLGIEQVSNFLVLKETYQKHLFVQKK